MIGNLLKPARALGAAARTSACTVLLAGACTLPWAGPVSAQPVGAPQGAVAGGIAAPVPASPPDVPALPQEALPSPQADEGDDGTIVVRGQTEAPTRSAISRQARSIAPPQNMYRLPLARFEDRLCPGVAGLPPEYAVMMVARIRAKAEALKLWMGDEEKCSPNFIIAFVADGQKFLTDLLDQQSAAFQDMSPAQRRALLAQPGPARVWTQTSTRTRDGMPVPKGEGLANPPVVQMAMAHSKIYLSTREDITAVMVLFDKEQLIGKTLNQLADYAMMRGLAQTRPPASDGTAMDTILTLFDPDTAPPLELTSFDNAYLASLYDSISNLPAAAKLLGVSRQLRRAAQEEEQEP